MDGSVASLSQTALGIFSAETSFTNRSGKFRIFQSGSRDQDCQQRTPRAVAHPCATKIKDSPVLAPSTTKAEPMPEISEPMPSPRASEPDAEPDVAEGPSDRQKQREAEIRSLTAELSGAKEQVAQLKAARAKDSEELAAERRCRKAIEEDAAKLRTRCRLHEQYATKLKNQKANLAKANDILERRLKEMRKGMNTSRNHRGQYSLDELAAQLAAAECIPLDRCSSDERAILKKKLLLKWHPDKQPSNEHSSFATCVLQEMQNCPAWQK